MNQPPAQKNAIILFAISDYVMAILAWIVFWRYRQTALYEASPEWFVPKTVWDSRDWIIGALVIPIFWIFLYYLSGTYADPYRKSRLLEIYRSIISTIIGVLTIGFIAYANDTDSFKYFFSITAWYLFVHVSILVVARMIILFRIKAQLRRKEIGYNTIIVGGNGKAAKVYHEVKDNRHSVGNIIRGFVTADNNIPPEPIDDVPVLGHLEQLEQIIDQHQIDEVIIAVESHEHQRLENILVKLSYRNVIVKVLPDLYDIISGSVRTSNVYDPLLISIYPELLPDWQKACKRVLDLTVSLSSLVVLLPIYIFAAIKVKLSSPGPVFYKQQRIGLFGKPFYIYKFRSMYIDAEQYGPALSSDEDPRITPWGRIMRKWRIDELPQFFNIVKGDMSLVGPRPERKHFIDLIIQTHPHYKYLHRVKPGLTSWGMVQYGYAENVAQMLERMKYDLLYIENCSLALDMKIMIYTIKVILQGRGK